MCPKSSCRLKNGFYPLHFMTVILSHRWDFPCCRTNPQNACAQPASYSCLAQNSVYALFCDVQAAFLGRFTALKSSLHWLSVKRIKAVEEALNRWARRALDDEMPGDLFLAALANSIEALRLKCGCKGITNRSSITFLI